MAYKLIDGDYAVPAGARTPEECDYIDELVQNAQVVLNTKREKFYPNKDFGSLIYKTNSEPIEAYLEMAARQAVDAIDGVYVKSVTYSNNTATIVLIANDTERTVIIRNEDNV